jgi:hypothetical protein
MTENFAMFDARSRTQQDNNYAEAMERYVDETVGSNMDRLYNFTKYVPRQTLSTFLAKNELFQKVIHTHGYIVECGVYLGAGLMTWANLSAIYEPFNHIRRIVGFDTFTGFTRIDTKDKGDNTVQAVEGGLAVRGAQADIEESIRLYDLNRPIGHIPRAQLVVGDAVKTIPQYVDENRHAMVALLYLDFDVYEPTKVAIETFLPRMPKGAIIAFDELNQAAWPGETLAVLETVGIRNLRIQRFPYASNLSYAVLE